MNYFSPWNMSKPSQCILTDLFCKTTSLSHLLFFYYLLSFVSLHQNNSNKVILVLYFALHTYIIVSYFDQWLLWYFGTQQRSPRIWQVKFIPRMPSSLPSVYSCVFVRHSSPLHKHLHRLLSLLLSLHWFITPGICEHLLLQFSRWWTLYLRLQWHFHYRTVASSHMGT